MKCSKCDGEMKEGLLVDAAFGGARKATWIKGYELPTIKLSLLPPGAEVTGERYHLSVYRCDSCGFCDVYAKEKALD